MGYIERKIKFDEEDISLQSIKTKPANAPCRLSAMKFMKFNTCATTSPAGKDIFQHTNAVK